MDHFKNLYCLCYNIVSKPIFFLGFFFLFGHAAHGISAPQPGIEPTFPALEGRVLALDYQRSPNFDILLDCVKVLLILMTGVLALL